MLCRVLIAAVAVTCTLSCTHAHGQGTPRLDRIKDLMCVLILSGMQKEDLDVSMLTKLQRHNVNINDFNNEELVEACIQSRYNNSKVIGITETEPSAAKIKNKILGDFNSHAALDILKRPPDAVNENLNNASVHKGRHAFRLDENRPSLNNAGENKANIDEIIQYSNGQPKLGSILKFWQDMGMNEAMKDQPTQKSVSMKEQDNKRSIKENLHSTETDTINKLLANFFLKGRHISTMPTSTQKSVNVFNKLYSSRTQDVERMSDGNADFEPSLIYSPTYQNAQKSIGKDNIENKSEPNRKVQNILNIENLTDVLTLFNYFKTSNVLIPDTEATDNLNRKTKESSKLSRNQNANSFKTFKKSERVDNISSSESNGLISRGMIKEIAESVKELILRDLRREIHETTTLTTTLSTAAAQSTTKTESIIQTTLKKDNTEAQESVMNKFLELFEEIKSLKQNIMVITSDNKKEAPRKSIREKAGNKGIYTKIEVPTKTSNSVTGPKLYGIKEYPNINSGKIFNFAPQLHKFRSNGSFIKQEPKKDLFPLTFQTNNIEIPPLGIPLDKPQNPINQNIVITTMTPYRITENKKRNGQRGGRYVDINKSTEVYKPKELHPRLSNERHTGHPIHQFYSNDNEDVIRFTLNNNKHSNYNADYYEKINLGKYKSRSDNAAYEPKHHAIPRFHEKLENVGRLIDYQDIDKVDCCNEKLGYSKAKVDECCNTKIAPRQQISLNNIKKSEYDDTHFKKFLQTQQKVTDMLERILAEKGHIQSVETA